MLATSRFLDESESWPVRVPDGREYVAPHEYFAPQSDGSLRLTLSIAELERTHAGPRIVILAIEEQLQVGKRTFGEGLIRVQNTLETSACWRNTMALSEYR
jgi:hypothetical protein